MFKIMSILIAFTFILTCSLSADENEEVSVSLSDLKSQANGILKLGNVSARSKIDIVFKLVDQLIKEKQYKEAENYLVQGLRHFPWNLKYQMIYADLLVKSGNQEKANEKANLVLEYAETEELIERAQKFLNKKVFPDFTKISNLPGKEHCVVLVPMQGCDKWLVYRLRNELSSALGIPVYIQSVNIKYPTFSRDLYKITINRMRERLIKWIDDPEIASAMNDLNLTKNDLEQEEDVIRLMKHLLKDHDQARKSFDENLERSKGQRPQWNAGKLHNLLYQAIKPYRRKNTAYLGITSVDIYSKDNNFLFGHANSLCGIMSYRRFTAEFNNETPNQDRLIKRTLMQCLSSIGHIYRVKRCTDPTCARAYPNSLMEHDAKRGTLCSVCRDSFKKILEK